MKKLFSMVLAGMLLFCGIVCLSACQEENNEEKEIGDGFVENPIDLSGKAIVGLKNAYLGGLLSREDLKNISYFYSGKVIEATGSDCTGEENSHWSDGTYTVNGEVIESKEIDYTPTVETPVLTEELKDELVIAYYNARKTLIEEGNKTADDITIKKYLGEYNGHYAAIFNVNGFDGMTVIIELYVGGIKFCYADSASYISVVI